MTLLTVIDGGGERQEVASDVVAVADEHVQPAVDALRLAAQVGDIVAVRVYALEIVALAGCIAATCGAPPRQAASG